MKYTIWRTIGVADYHEVEADSKEKAKEIAWDLPIDYTQVIYIDDSIIITDEDIQECQ
jgi:hypothetical protein